MTRRTVVFAGPADWGRTVAARQLPAHADVRWIGEGAPAGVVSHAADAFRQVLGATVDIVVLDAHAGFDPDALGAAAGSVRGGGLLVLLVPPWTEWSDHPDPVLNRLIPAGYLRRDAAGRFVTRLIAQLAATPDVERIAPDDALPDLTPGPWPAAERGLPYGCWSDDQRQAVEAVMRVVTGHRRRPVVLRADRGRGKSAALGIAIGELARQGRVQRVWVTAPRLQAAEPVLRHAAAQAQGEADGRRAVVIGTARVEYREAETLATTKTPADLVVIDEAAGLPVALLGRLLAAAPRVAFATTVHGYEGSGRGFELRFQPILERRAPQWRAVALKTPVRWASGDPLEAWVSRALCLDAEPVSLTALPDVAAVRVARYDPDTLLTDERRLRQVFGLLIAAHYRTRPLDLRQLLDAPNVELFLAVAAQGVVGVVLAAREGGLEPGLAREVWAGRRRPQGHLLPQILATHAGLETAPTGRALRILRIAVHPELRRCGLGARLVEAVLNEGKRRGCALVGTSFGATPELVRFWAACGLETVAIGARRDPASGEHSAVMAQGLDRTGAGWVQAGGDRLGQAAPALLGEPLRCLEPEVAMELFAAARSGGGVALRDWQRRELAGFAHAQRDYAVALPALQVLAGLLLTGAVSAVGRMRGCEPALIGKVLQHREWAETAEWLGVSGRRQALARLRAAVADLLE